MAAALCKDAVIAKATLTQIVLLANLLPVSGVSFSLAVPWVGLSDSGGPSRDIVFDLSRNDWPFL